MPFSFLDRPLSRIGHTFGNELLIFVEFGPGFKTPAALWTGRGFVETDVHTLEVLPRPFIIL